MGRRIFNQNEMNEYADASVAEQEEKDDLLKEVPDYERSAKAKAQMETFVKDFNTLVISDKSGSKSKASTGKYLHLDDFEFCQSHTNFKDAEILSWFKGFRK